MASNKDKVNEAIEPKPHAIDLLSNPASNAYSHIHPLLVLAVLYASFSNVVEDPVTWLTYLLVPLAGLQGLFAIICVPASSEARNATQSTSSKGTLVPRKKQKSNASVSLGSKISPAILSILASFTVTTLPIFVLLVLHGAPITTHIPHTALLATHISLLACIPLFYAHGVDATKWRMVYSLQAPVDEVMGAAIGTILGSWMGAIPIPLDWDREWQKWPVTVVVGAYAGWAIGGRLGAIPWIRGRVVEFD